MTTRCFPGISIIYAKIGPKEQPLQLMVYKKYCTFKFSTQFAEYLTSALQTGNLLN